MSWQNHGEGGGGGAGGIVEGGTARRVAGENHLHEGSEAHRLELAFRRRREHGSDEPIKVGTKATDCARGLQVVHGEDAPELFEDGLGQIKLLQQAGQVILKTPHLLIYF